MKIPSAKPEMEGQIAGQENLLTQTLPSSVDFLSSLLLQLSNSLQVKPDSPEITAANPQEEMKTETANVTAPSVEPPPTKQALDFIINDLMEKQANFSFSDVTEANEIAIPLTKLNEEEIKSTVLTDAVSEKVNKLTELTEFKELNKGSDVSEKSSLEKNKLVNDLDYQPDYQKETLAAKVSDVVMQQADLSVDLTKESKLDNKPQLTMKSPLKPQEMSTADTLDRPDINLSSPIFSAPLSTVTVKNDAPLNNHPDNNYLNLFTQVGNILNNQTSQFNVNPATDPTLNDANNMAKTTHIFDPAHDLQVETSPFPMGGHDVIDAKIKLYPPELGHVIAKLKMNKNEAELVILTENNHVKQIVETNLPLLKQHFQEANIHLTSINIQTAMNDEKEGNAFRNKTPVFDEEKQNEAKQNKKLSSESNQASQHTLVDTYA